MKVHVFKRSIPESLWEQNIQEPKEVAYCGYLELDNPLEEDLWDWCNWSCWSQEGRPKECEHLLIGFCNSDVAYYINGEWYSHGMEKFDNFQHCYNEMVGNTRNEYFKALWPTDSGFLEEDTIQIVTPKNIKDFIQ